MKDYLVFLGENYYPKGGWEDFKKDFESFEECIHYINLEENKYFSWCHIVCKDKSVKKYYHAFRVGWISEDDRGYESF
jgi:hypothetical protein